MEIIHLQDKGESIPMSNGSRDLAGKYQVVESNVLDHDAHVVQGLVVDPSAAGIGFRNHTVPTSAGTLATWSEDLLFTTPEIACVAMNLTFDFTIGNSTDSSCYYKIPGYHTRGCLHPLVC